MLNIKDYYNNAYRKFTPDYIQSSNISKINAYLNENAQTLINFFTEYTEQFNLELGLSQKSCLELGCGIGSLSYFLNDKFYEFKAIDNSELAISTAKEISNIKEKNIDFCVASVTSAIDLGVKYDFIIDSHLFHCLTLASDRRAYIEFVKRHLKLGGQFLLETMAFQPKMQIPVGYQMDENCILFKEIDSKVIPVRSIQKSIDIETELNDLGLRINYLYFHNELSFHVFDDYHNYPEEYCPKTIRLSCLAE